jgi:hypothetical protein
MHPEYVKVSQMIQTALRCARLDDVVEVEGPSKLGGWLLRDGGRRVALSRLPGDPRLRGDRGGRGNRGERAPLWYVSAWYEIYDELEEMVEGVEGVDFTRQREVVLGTTESTEDAVIAAVKVLVEGRIEDGFREERAACEPDEPPPPDAAEKRRFPVWGTARRQASTSSRSLASRV